MNTTSQRVSQQTLPHKKRRQINAGYVFLTPWMLGLALLTLGPMIASLYFSFTDFDLFGAPGWVGFDNYARMLEDPRFASAVKVTLKYVAFAAPLKLILALAVALLLNRPRKAQGFYRAAFYAPSLLGASVSVALVWRIMFSDRGIVDNGLQAVGINMGGWISNPKYAVYTLVILAVWQFGAPMVIFLAGLKQVPTELYDAAAMDGAGTLRTFKSITLPMLSPVILFNLVLETINAFQAFTGAYVISGGRGRPMDSTLFFTLYLYDRAFVAFEMGYASAMAWVLLVTIALATWAIFRTAKLWVFYSGEDR